MASAAQRQAPQPTFEAQPLEAQDLDTELAELWRLKYLVTKQQALVTKLEGEKIAAGAGFTERSVGHPVKPERLPAKLWAQIGAHLDLVDKGCLAFTTKFLKGIFGRSRARSSVSAELDPNLGRS